MKRAERRAWESADGPSPIRLTWDGKNDRSPPPRGRLVSLARGSSSLRLIQGENWMTLDALVPELRGKVALAYLDPPFFTGRVHVKLTRGRDTAGKVLRALSPAFDDRWT